MSQSPDQSDGLGAVADSLTDDMGRPIPELVLPVLALAAVALLAWVWRRSAEART